MITRNIYSTVAKALKRFPAVAILGPRQVGKTTLVKQVSKLLKGEVLFLDLKRIPIIINLTAMLKIFYRTM